MDEVLGIPNLRSGETPGDRPTSGGRCGCSSTHAALETTRDASCRRSPSLPPTFLDRKSPRSWQLTAGTSYYRQPNRGSAREFQDKIYRSLKFKHKRPCRESITVAEAALPAGEKQWKSGFIMNFTAGRSRPRRLRSRRRWDKSRRPTPGGSTRFGSPKFTSSRAARY